MAEHQIIAVTRENLFAAAVIHAEAWKESHKSFCSAAFVQQHTVERQMVYLQKELDAGKRLYMLLCTMPVGIVSVKEDVIENLYVLPGEQRKGCGTYLLRFAMEQCRSTPELWVLSNNNSARKLYARMGFCEAGKKLSADLYELEMKAPRR